MQHGIVKKMENILSSNFCFRNRVEACGGAFTSFVQVFLSTLGY